jgi:hypothetical protein
MGKTKRMERPPNRTTRKRGGNGAMTAINAVRSRIPVGFKYLITRLINPSNANRMLYKNALFLGFIDPANVQTMYKRKFGIDVEFSKEYGYWYIYPKGTRQSVSVMNFAHNTGRRLAFNLLNDSPLMDDMCDITKTDCVMFQSQYSELFKFLYLWKYYVDRAMWFKDENLYTIKFMMKTCVEYIMKTELKDTFIEKNKSIMRAVFGMSFRGAYGLHDDDVHMNEQLWNILNVDSEIFDVNTDLQNMEAPPPATADYTTPAVTPETKPHVFQTSTNPKDPSAINRRLTSVIPRQPKLHTISDSESKLTSSSDYYYYYKNDNIELAMLQYYEYIPHFFTIDQMKYNVLSKKIPNFLRTELLYAIFVEFCSTLKRKDGVAISLIELIEFNKRNTNLDINLDNTPYVYKKSIDIPNYSFESFVIAMNRLSPEAIDDFFKFGNKTTSDQWSRMFDNIGINTQKSIFKETFHRMIDRIMHNIIISKDTTVKTIDGNPVKMSEQIVEFFGILFERTMALLGLSSNIQSMRISHIVSQNIRPIVGNTFISQLNHIFLKRYAPLESDGSIIKYSPKQVLTDAILGEMYFIDTDISTYAVPMHITSIKPVLGKDDVAITTDIMPIPVSLPKTTPIYHLNTFRLYDLKYRQEDPVTFERALKYAIQTSQFLAVNSKPVGMLKHYTVSTFNTYTLTFREAYGKPYSVSIPLKKLRTVPTQGDFWVSLVKLDKLKFRKAAVEMTPLVKMFPDYFPLSTYINKLNQSVDDDYKEIQTYDLPPEYVEPPPKYVPKRNIIMFVIHDAWNQPIKWRDELHIFKYKYTSPENIGNIYGIPIQYKIICTVTKSRMINSNTRVQIDYKNARYDHPEGTPDLDELQTSGSFTFDVISATEAFRMKGADFHYNSNDYIINSDQFFVTHVDIDLIMNDKNQLIVDKAIHTIDRIDKTARAAITDISDNRIYIPGDVLFNDTKTRITKISYYDNVFKPKIHVRYNKMYNDATITLDGKPYVIPILFTNTNSYTQTLLKRVYKIMDPRIKAIPTKPIFGK